MAEVSIGLIHPRLAPKTPAPMTRVLLIRHGETPWNRDRRWQGHAGVGANGGGGGQAAGRATPHKAARGPPAVLHLLGPRWPRLPEAAAADNAAASEPSWNGAAWSIGRRNHQPHLEFGRDGAVE